MKGCVLAGGSGTRMGRLTRGLNKHLLPMGHEPMVCHGVRKLVEYGITDIAVVTTPESVELFQRVLGDGSEFGCAVTHCVQDEPRGVAHALSLTERFCAGERLVVLLGDNIFQESLASIFRGLASDLADSSVAWAATRKMDDPRPYAVVNRRQDGTFWLQEKPYFTWSREAVVGIYAYPPDVYDRIRELRPSERCELEICDLNMGYVESPARCQLALAPMSPDLVWFDAGTPTSWMAAQMAMYREAMPCKSG